MDLRTEIKVLEQHYEDIANNLINCGNCNPVSIQWALLDALNLMRIKASDGGSMNAAVLSREQVNSLYSCTGYEDPEEVSLRLRIPLEIVKRHFPIIRRNTDINKEK